LFINLFKSNRIDEGSLQISSTSLQRPHELRKGHEQRAEVDSKGGMGVRAEEEGPQIGANNEKAQSSLNTYEAAIEARQIK